MADEQLHHAGGQDVGGDTGSGTARDVSPNTGGVAGESSRDAAAAATHLRRSRTVTASRSRDWETPEHTVTSRPRGMTTGGIAPRLPSIGSRRRSTQTRPRSIALSSGRAPSVPAGFSLGGPQDTAASKNLHQPYVDPGYSELNPAYAQPVNTRPVWGLAKPLPRVVRPGMVPSTSELDVSAGAAADETDNVDKTTRDLEKGKIKPTLQLGKISSSIQTAREQRENRVLQKYGSRTSAIAPLTRPQKLANPSLTPHDEILEEEEDMGQAHPGEADDHEISPATSVFAALDDAASQADTENEIEDGWMDTMPLKPYDPEDEVHNLHNHWSVIRARFREPLAEFLATTVQCILGFSVDLASAVSSSRSGNETTIGLGWGIAVMLGIYIAGGISGAHLNPAISIMLYIYRGFPLRKVPSYILAQVLAAFCAALIAYGIYRKDIIEFGGVNLGQGGTVDSFITNPRYDWIDAATAFFTEFTGTAILAIAVLATGDDTNAPPGAGMNAFILGIIVAVLIWTFGYNTGAALNPARDLGPRFAVLALGYGGQVFRNGWWVYGPWAGTILGAVFGGALYDTFIFVGGESPINYPRKRMKRAGRKWRHRWSGRIRRAKARVLVKGKMEDYGDEKRDGTAVN
ncbi:MAG: hypothetical protein M1818_006533 [Claussenomyces sp. TS43310]|nr:MAG: hypothetical protein M1818_006533 [Claussenomyces sp. TS43310]